MTAAVVLAVAVEMSAQCAFSVAIAMMWGVGPHQHPFSSIAIIAQPPFSAKNICTMVSYYES